MDSANKESSPAPSVRGIKGVFAKALRNNKDNDSSINDISDARSARGGVRSSIDSALLKLKTRANGDSSLEDGDASSGDTGAMSKLLPGHKKRRRKKREAQQADEDAEEPRGRSLGNGGTKNPTYLGADNPSQSTLNDDDDGSSLVTVDSELDSPVTTPPPLISHQSHIGYLTSSSPQIKAFTGPAPSIPPQSIDSPATRLSQTLSPNTNLATSNVAAIDPVKTQSTLSVDSVSSNRSKGVSPGTKIKEVLKSGSRKKGNTPNGSPERESVASTNAGTALGVLFNKEKRNSMSTRRASRSSEDAPNVPPAIQIQATTPKSTKTGLSTIDTVPQTPPSVETPLTTITPPTPVDRVERSTIPESPVRKAVAPASTPNPNVVTSASGNMISHRRVRSDSATHPPSKLSNSISAPLTPMIEEGSLPGSRAGSGNQATSFFSSVFVAAQNAANTFSNSIGNNPPRSRSGTQTDDEDNKSQVAPVTVVEENEAPEDQQKRLAIDTIGTGDLSLSHLGISTDTLPSYTSANNPVAPNGNSMHKEEVAARAEDVSAARAVSAAYGERDGTPVVEDGASAPNTRSVYESSIAGDKTPPNGSIFEGESGGGLWRSGSVRSRVEKVARRHRNSSGATGTTIGAAIGASHTALSNPALNSSVPKLTGFAVASKKRNRDFHQFFRSVPEDDYLIEDYSCALQREIILAGRIYISEGHICFSSNILGWVTTLVISFDEVVSVEKENTAMVFPNAIAIQTLQARHTFRSLLARESTYDLLIGIWKINHPSLSHSQNGAKVVDGGTGDKTEKAEPTGSEDGSDGSEEEEDVYDEDEDDDDGAGSFVEDGDGSIAGSELVPDVQSKPVARKVSAVGVAIGQANGGFPSQSDAKMAEKAGAAAVASTEFAGPTTHAPTECADSATHYDKLLKDEVIPAPLGKIYSMMFGPASGGFMTRWLLDDVKVTDLQFEDDKKGLSLENPTRSYTYIKPLYAAIGPKSTKCIITEQLDALDLEKAVSVSVTTQTPDVPSGNVFSTKTKYCISWGPGNGTRFVMNCTIEWTGKSWLKGPIEKGANDGQTTHANDLVKALRAGVASRPRAGTTTSRMKKGGRRRKGDADTSKTSTSTAAAKAEPLVSNWGLLEPLHSLLSPIIDILSPLMNANSLIGLLLFLLIISWFRNSRLGNHGASRNPAIYSSLSTPQRIAAYEEIWRTEESALWDWLEDRVGMSDGAAYPIARRGNGDGSRQARKERAKVLMGEGEEVGGMAKKEMEWAIGVTEERLRVLKEAVVGGGGGEEGGGGGGESQVDVSSTDIDTEKEKEG